MKIYKLLKNNIEIISLFLILIIFGFFYADMIFSLPLFGDATIHGSITKNILEKGIRNTGFKYPPFYNNLQGTLFLFFGEPGMNYIVFLGLLLIGISTFLFTRELINIKIVPYLATIIVLASPKLIFYSARMYMEIFLSGFFIFTLFLLMKFLKKKSFEYILLLSFFTAFTASIKQQGLFILFPSILFFLFILVLPKIFHKRWGKAKSNLKNIGIFFLIFMLFIFLPYHSLFHSNGEIIPTENKIINSINEFGQKISGYKKPEKLQEYNKKWGKRLEEIGKEYYETGSQRAEKRHIWPLEAISSSEGLRSTHSLYLENFAQGNTSSILSNSMNILAILGMVIILLNLIPKNKILKNKSKYFLLFLVIFLVINYFLFLRNTDQMRYHLFIPIIFSIFPALFVGFIVRKIITKNFNKKIKIISIVLIIVLILLPLLSLTMKDTKFNKRWDNSQVYSPSKGGVASIKEAGLWLKNNTNKNSLIYQRCGNELMYYSNRDVTGDWRYFFLKTSELKKVFEERKIQYIVLFNSQIVPDEKWKNFCWVPNSFAKKIKKNYPKVYETSFNDIKIYEVGKL